jgi:acetyl-CoA carboxylase biotin carboxylase subunit
MNTRLDSALYAGYSIPPYYDSLIGKLIVWGNTREGAILRLRRALGEMVIEGVQTTIPLHEALLDNEDFQKGDYNIHWLEKWLEEQG